MQTRRRRYPRIFNRGRKRREEEESAPKAAAAIIVGVTLPFLVGGEREKESGRAGGDNRFFLVSSHRENGLVTEWLILDEVVWKDHLKAL